MFAEKGLLFLSDGFLLLLRQRERERGMKPSLETSLLLTDILQLLEAFPLSGFRLDLSKGTRSGSEYT